MESVRVFFFFSVENILKSSLVKKRLHTPESPGFVFCLAALALKLDACVSLRAKGPCYGQNVRSKDFLQNLSVFHLTWYIVCCICSHEYYHQYATLRSRSKDFLQNFSVFHLTWHIVFMRASMLHLLAWILSPIRNTPEYIFPGTAYCLLPGTPLSVTRSCTYICKVDMAHFSSRRWHTTEARWCSVENWRLSSNGDNKDASPAFKGLAVVQVAVTASGT